MAAVCLRQDSDIIMNHNNGFTVDRAICHLVSWKWQKFLFRSEQTVSNCFSLWQEVRCQKIIPVAKMMIY